MSPPPVRRLRQVGHWMLRAFGGASPVLDPFGSFRLFRVSVLRDLMKARGESRIVQGDRWTANADLLLGALPFARRTETVACEAHYNLRLRESRVRPFADGVQIFRFARGARSRHPSLPARARA